MLFCLFLFVFGVIVLWRDSGLSGRSQVFLKRQFVQQVSFIILVETPEPPVLLEKRCQANFRCVYQIQGSSPAIDVTPQQRGELCVCEEMTFLPPGPGSCVNLDPGGSHSWSADRPKKETCFILERQLLLWMKEWFGVLTLKDSPFQLRCLWRNPLSYSRGSPHPTITRL